MIHLKNFIRFVNEGAWYEGGKDEKIKRNEYITAKDRKVFLSIKNDPNNPKELFKTVEPNGENYDMRGYKGIAPIKVYYGLYPKSKYHKDNDESQDAKQNIMDHLKKANPEIFSMAPGENMEDFIKYTLLNKNNKNININTEINYVVRVGSSADLVNAMSDSLQKIYPNATFIDLNKIKYTNPMDGVDVDEYEKKIKSEFEKNRYDKETGEPLPSSSRTFTQVKAWLRRMERNLKQMIENGEEPFYHIKSSGFQPGLRSTLRPKYDTSADAFIDAVHHCAFGDENGNLAKMILVDDNTQQGIDFGNISTKIIEILAGIIDITKNDTKEILLSNDVLNKIKSEYEAKRINRKLDTQLDVIEKSALENVTDNIFGYVLYNFGPDIEKISFKEKDLKEVLIETTKEVIGDKLEPIKAEIIEYTTKLNASYRYTMDKVEFVSPYSLGMKGDYTYEDLLNDIINKSVDKIWARDSSTDTKEEIAKKLKDTFDDYKPYILPIKDTVKETPSKTIVPMYPELANLVDGTKVINKMAGKEGELVGVSQETGKAQVLFPDGRKTLLLDLKILAKNWEVL
jgi:hypothetical protein